MKVKLKNVNSDNNQILLSIGMIVKNEERHLENCMKALMPLRQQIKSELIIVDTGSTDRTIEIAKKYADKFYEFEWCNDFSAARNYGLERAEGLWFMFIDADEYFDEDISEIVNFFKYPELYMKYRSASYKIRNYLDCTQKYFSDFLASRMIRREPDIRFEGEIHEALPMYAPHGFFTTIAHHYGYAYKSVDQRMAKKERNLKPLLEELEKDPENSRTLAHLVDISNEEDVGKYLEIWIEVCRKGKGLGYRNHCYKEYIAYLGHNERYDEAEKIYEEYMALDGAENSACTIQIYAMMALLYYNQDNFEKSYEYYLKYFEIYRQYLNNELNLNDLRYSAIKGINNLDYYEGMINAAHCLFRLERDEEALKLLSEIDIKNIDLARFSKYIKIISALAENAEYYKYIADIYKRILEMNDSDKISIANKQIEDFYYDNPDTRIEFAKEISKIKSDDAFISMMKIIANEKNKNTPQKIQKLVNSIDDWNGGYSELIYLAMKYKTDVSEAIPKMTYEQTRDYFVKIASKHDDYAEVTLEYSQEFSFTDSIKQLFWIVSALEVAVLNSKELQNSDKHDLYYIFISMLSDYVFNIYNPEIFNENDVEIMPPLHRFGYYMGTAMMALNEGNKIAYIRLIKTALKNSEPMKELVAFLLEEFETGLK
ncbi:MAG: glycosyltransferase [Oscillospiraceae bacterium]